MIGELDKALATGAAPAASHPEAVIASRPVACGWMVSCRLWGEPLMFLSPRSAERAARGMARTLAQLGGAVRLELFDARGFLDQAIRRGPQSERAGDVSA